MTTATNRSTTLSQDHIQIVKDIYDAVGRGDLDTILERVADDVDRAAVVAGNTPR